jgi:hypothetical protein
MTSAITLGLKGWNLAENTVWIDMRNSVHARLVKLHRFYRNLSLLRLLRTRVSQIMYIILIAAFLLATESTQYNVLGQSAASRREISPTLRGLNLSPFSGWCWWLHETQTVKLVSYWAECWPLSTRLSSWEYFIALFGRESLKTTLNELLGFTTS